LSLSIGECRTKSQWSNRWIHSISRFEFVDVNVFRLQCIFIRDNYIQQYSICCFLLIQTSSRTFRLRIAVKSCLNFFQVVSLPSQVCIAKQKIYDSLSASASNVLRAAVVKVSGRIRPTHRSTIRYSCIGAACLTCYLSSNRILVYSLPSLRELFITNLDPMIDSFR
jgi:hypothetical protein